MKKILLGSTLLIAATASGAFAATVTKTVSADFSVTNQSLFGSGGAAAFNGSVGLGSNTSTFQFKASTGASTGTVNSNANVMVKAAFESAQQLGTGTVDLSFGGASANFSTALGAFMDVTATVRTPKISIPLAPDIPAVSVPFNLVDEDYQLNAAKSDATYSFGQTLSDSDSVSLPGAGAGALITVSANPNVDQTSSLKLSGLSAILQAVNQTTGTILNQAFSFSGGSQSLDLNYGEAGIWDLSLKNVSLASTFNSVFGLSATFGGGASIGLGCGNPATNSDNGFACLWDEGVDFTTPTANLLSASPFSLNYNKVTSLSLGSVTVAQGVTPVPLPAALPMLAVSIGFGAWVGRRKAKAALAA